MDHQHKQISFKILSVRQVDKIKASTISIRPKKHSSRICIWEEFTHYICQSQTRASQKKAPLATESKEAEAWKTFYTRWGPTLLENSGLS